MSSEYFSGCETGQMYSVRIFFSPKRVLRVRACKLTCKTVHLVFFRIIFTNCFAGFFDRSILVELSKYFYIAIIIYHFDDTWF